MGFFDVFKSSPKGVKAKNIDRELLEFLKKVDELYMVSYQLKSTKDISRYLSRDCAARLSSTVCSVNVRYFGESKYRNTVWINEGVADGIITIRKEVTFDNIKIAGKLAIAIASDYTERWLVSSRDRLIVERIQLLT